MSQKINVTSPVGRIVRGSLYEPQKTNMDGHPLVIKSGPNAGQPRVDYSFSIAIPKNPGETHWAQTPWGQQIWGVGHAAYPQQAALAGFAWKVIDGDDTTPSMKSKPPGKRPCDNEGYKGNWIIRFSGGFAPVVYQFDNSIGKHVQNTQKDFVKAGYYVEVAFTVEGNTGQSPGVYINHSMVNFRGYGPEINFGPDVGSAGFGAAPLPPGASATPLDSTAPLPQLPAPMATPPTIPVVPNTSFVQVPPPAAAIAPPAPPPPMPAKQMTAKANGATYEQCIAAGWTDVTLVQHGMMLA